MERRESCALWNVKYGGTYNDGGTVHVSVLHCFLPRCQVPVVPLQRVGAGSKQQFDTLQAAVAGGEVEGRGPEVVEGVWRDVPGFHCQGRGTDTRQQGLQDEGLLCAGRRVQGGVATALKGRGKGGGT